MKSYFVGAVGLEVNVKSYIEPKGTWLQSQD